MDYRKYQSSRAVLHVITAPFLWLPLPFIIISDILSEIYQAICFPIYKIPKVKRSEYILIIDRNKLQYLSNFEKLGCMYCGYANGLFLYLKEVAGRTEKYWCGVMHENKPGFKAQIDQTKRGYAKYNDKSEFDSKYPLK